MMQQKIGICMVAAAMVAPALAQSEVLIFVENPTLSPGQSTTVTLSAAFPPRDFAMAGIQTDLLISAGSDGWSDIGLVGAMAGPGTSEGVPTAAGFESIIAGQINFPVPGATATDNPIPFWQATYTAPTSPGTPFDVNLSTLTSTFDAYIEFDSSATRSYLDGLVEGSATIHVIPAPATTLVLATAMLFSRRRR